jgi:hypothetical protein
VNMIDFMDVPAVHTKLNENHLKYILWIIFIFVLCQIELFDICCDFFNNFTFRII